MNNQKDMVKSLEAMLDMLPNTLTEEEKKKADEIREMLEQLKTRE